MDRHLTVSEISSGADNNKINKCFLFLLGHLPPQANSSFNGVPPFPSNVPFVGGKFKYLNY